MKNLNKLKKAKDRLEDESQRSLDKVKDLFGGLESSGGNILALSKESINASINNNFETAAGSLKSAEKEIVEFDKGLFKARRILGELLANRKLKTGDLQNVYQRLDNFEKDFSAAKEEFFEAKILYFYLKTGGRKILGPAGLPLADLEAYAGALSDFCGELVRKARTAAIQLRQPADGAGKDIGLYYSDAQDIYQALSNFSFSNKSGIRPKVERLKNFIAELEKILYDLRLR